LCVRGLQPTLQYRRCARLILPVNLGLHLLGLGGAAPARERLCELRCSRRRRVLARPAGLGLRLAPLLALRWWLAIRCGGAAGTRAATRPPPWAFTAVATAASGGVLLPTRARDAQWAAPHWATLRFRRRSVAPAWRVRGAWARRREPCPRRWPRELLPLLQRLRLNLELSDAVEQGGGRVRDRRLAIRHECRLQRSSREVLLAVHHAERRQRFGQLGAHGTELLLESSPRRDGAGRHQPTAPVLAAASQSREGRHPQLHLDHAVVQRS
jgi:hypothetical protein